MKQNNYESPVIETINIGSEGLLCSSIMNGPADGNSPMIEDWQEEQFVW